MALQRDGGTLGRCVPVDESNRVENRRCILDFFTDVVKFRRSFRSGAASCANASCSRMTTFVEDKALIRHVSTWFVLNFMCRGPVGGSQMYVNSRVSRSVYEVRLFLKTYVSGL